MTLADEDTNSIPTDDVDPRQCIAMWQIKWLATNAKDATRRPNLSGVTIVITHVYELNSGPAVPLTMFRILKRWKMEGMMRMV